MQGFRQLAVAVAVLSAAPTARAGVTTIDDFRIEYAGPSIGPYTDLDKAVMAWMTNQNIHYGQLAVRRSGKLIVSHAYTMGKAYKLATTENVFRLASISKMLVTAAFSNLLNKGSLTGGERVYSYLGITAPLLVSQKPDRRSKDIISLELAEHTAGLPGEGTGDPLFEMRDIEEKLGHEPLTETDFARYLYGLPLLSTPGFTSLYSNVGYYLLGMVIEKAVKKPYASYITEDLLKPMGMTNWVVAPTLHKDADPNMVFADDPFVGPSVFKLGADGGSYPFNYEGGDIIWELAAAPGDFATNAESVSKFIGTYNVYGLGGRAIDYARDGCIPGAATWAESETSDIDFALLFNAQPCLGFSSDVINTIRGILASL